MNVRDHSPDDLAVSIVRTLAWFSLFSHPLTSLELWKWLLMPGRQYAFEEVVAALEEDAWLRQRIVSERGFFALAEGELIATLIERRQAGFLDAARKFKKLRRIVRFFGLLPSVRAVAACNSLAWHHTDSSSDIDLLVLVRPGSLWTTRLLLVAPFALLGKRPLRLPSRSSVDPFCFSFFLSTDAPSVAILQLLPRDPYLAYWTRSLVPVFERGNAWTDFQQANEWASSPLPNAYPQPPHSELAPSWVLPGIVPRISGFEAAAKRLQERRLPAEVKHMANQDSRVVVSDVMLKFHTNDRRAEFYERWKAVVEREGVLLE
ncbi:hypothetical protein HY734_01805 [Candidatus Uhrbacteria bacterium]|nr:hypothetical protein [Candidatus Uhrbacteria bacterium]